MEKYIIKEKNTFNVFLLMLIFEVSYFEEVFLEVLYTITIIRNIKLITQLIMSQFAQAQYILIVAKRVRKKASLSLPPIFTFSFNIHGVGPQLRISFAVFENVRYLILQRRTNRHHSLKFPQNFLCTEKKNHGSY